MKMRSLLLIIMIIGVGSSAVVNESTDHKEATTSNY